MSVVWLIGWLVVLLGVMAASAALFMGRTLGAVRTWAADSGVELLAAKVCLLRPTPFRFVSSMHVVYEIRAKMPDGEIRRAWVKASGVTRRVDVKWEGDLHRALRSPLSGFVGVLLVVSGLAILACAPVAGGVAIVWGAILLAGGIAVLGVHWLRRRSEPPGTG